MESNVDLIERVGRQQMRVLTAMQAGRGYYSDELASLSGLPVTRVRTALKALKSCGMVTCTYPPNHPLLGKNNKFGTRPYWRQCG
jgi:hypothetical protein